MGNYLEHVMEHNLKNWENLVSAGPDISVPNKRDVSDEAATKMYGAISQDVDLLRNYSIAEIKDYINGFTELLTRFYAGMGESYRTNNGGFKTAVDQDLKMFGLEGDLTVIGMIENNQNVNEIRQYVINRLGLANIYFPSKEDVLVATAKCNTGQISQEELAEIRKNAGYNNDGENFSIAQNIYMGIIREDNTKSL